MQTLLRSLEIAEGVLSAFKDNSAWDDYAECDGFNADSYDQMLFDIEQLVRLAKAGEIK